MQVWTREMESDEELKHICCHCGEERYDADG